MATKPSIEQIAEARAYILQRVSNQRLLEEELDREFDEAISKVALIILKYRNRGMKLRFKGSSMMAREIQEVIDYLESKIAELVDYYCIPDEAEDDKEAEDAIHAFIRAKDHGFTYDDRMTLYLSNIISELDEIDYDELLDMDLIEEAIGESIDKTENRIDLLALNSVAIAFAFFASEKAIELGTIGFYTYPGSGNPCTFCSDKFYLFQPITNEKPPYHPRCQCLTVYVYE